MITWHQTPQSADNCGKSRFDSLCMAWLLCLQMLMATTGNGWVVPLLIQQTIQEAGIAAGPLPGTSSEKAIQWGCWYTGATGSIVSNTGGTGEHARLRIRCLRLW
jgi:hypothetical protein